MIKIDKVCAMDDGLEKLLKIFDRINAGVLYNVPLSKL